MKTRKYAAKYLSFSVKDTIISMSVLILTLSIYFLLSKTDKVGAEFSFIFLFGVFIISRFTSGYFYGVASSVLTAAIFFSNSHFTFLEFLFILTAMIFVAISTGILTSGINQCDKIKAEAEKEKMRGNLLRAISHDLRTPLTSILGTSSVMIESDDILIKKDRLNFLYAIREDAQWLIRMVENLLSVTRIDGEARIVKHPEAAEELIAAAVAKFKKQFPTQSIAVSVPNELLMVPMDALLIEQVIINLLENSVLHAKNLTEIHLDVSRDDKNAIFTVSDNGNGISGEILPHIFDGLIKNPYDKTIDNKKNMGIGLSVCMAIIKAHDGTMAASNHNGAQFTFSLPLSAP